LALFISDKREGEKEHEPELIIYSLIPSIRIVQSALPNKSILLIRLKNAELAYHFIEPSSFG
jgi:hypothetical protein